MDVHHPWRFQWMRLVTSDFKSKKLMIEGKEEFSSSSRLLNALFSSNQETMLAVAQCVYLNQIMLLEWK